MIDYEYLKKLALAVPKDFAAPEAWEEDRRYLDDELAFLDFLKEATPEKILALIAENEALRKDAERYRAMFSDTYCGQPVFDYSNKWVGETKEEVDRMIDEEVSKEPKSE